MDIAVSDTAPVLMRGKFKDGDQFCSAASGWNIEFRQLDCGEMDARLEVAIGQSVAVQHFELKRRFHQLGSAPSGVLTFGMPNDCRKLNWYGKSLERDSLLNFSRRAGFDAVSDEDFGGYTFSIRTELLQDAVSSLDSSAQASRVPDMSDQFDASSADLQKMRRLAHGYHQCLTNQTGTEKAYQELESDMAHMIAKTVCESAGVEKNVSYAQRQVAVNRALQLILSTRDAVSVSDVYKYSAVSWRTLDRAFKERFGVSPKQYIVATRLVSVRRVLLSAPSDTKITEVANDWGFWHLGRFASDYKRMFGELPSETMGH